MTKSLIKQWLFINYCGQKIGQFKGADLKDSLVNITTSNISFIIYGIIFNIYLQLGFRSLFYFLLVAVPFEFLVTRKLVKKYLMTNVSMYDLEVRYKITPRWKRIAFFVLAILILILSYGIFIIIVLSIRYIK